MEKQTEKTKNFKSIESYNDVTFLSTPDILVHFRVEKQTSEDGTDTKKQVSSEVEKEPWGVLVSVFCFNTIMGYHFLCFGMYYVKLTEAFDSTKAAAGLIISIYSTFAAFTGLVASALEENFGARSVALAGSIIQFIGIFSSTFAPSIFVLCITYGAVAGIGSSLSMLANGVTIQKRFHKNRNMATSIAVCGIPFGNIISPILTNYLLESFGWRSTLLLHSGIILHTLLFAMTYWPDKHQSTKKSTSLKSILKSLCDFSSFQDFAFVLLIIGSVLIRFNTSIFFAHTASRAVYMGYSMNLAAYLLTALCICSLFTRLTMSVIMKFKFPNPILMFGLSGLLQGLVSIAVPLCSTYPLLATCTALFGTGQGLIVPVTILSLVKLGGVEKYGRSRALTNLFSNLSQFATPIAGWIFDVTQDYDIPFYVSGSIGVCGSLCAIVVFIIYKTRSKTSSKPKEQLDNGTVKDTKDELIHNLKQQERIRTFTF